MTYDYFGNSNDENVYKTKNKIMNKKINKIGYFNKSPWFNNLMQ